MKRQNESESISVPPVPCPPSRSSYQEGQLLISRAGNRPGVGTRPITLITQINVD